MKNFQFSIFNFQKKQNPSGGFTLVELIVSLGIFSISMLVATGAIFTIVNSNKKSHSLKSIVTNLNFVLEGMSRDIRVGSDYTCPNNGSTCSTAGDTAIAYTSNKDRDGIGGLDSIDYALNLSTNAITRRINCTVATAGCDTSGPVQITAPEIYVQNLKFYVMGTAQGDNEQPRVLMTVSGYVTATGVRSDFNIQTLLTQRKRSS